MAFTTPGTAVAGDVLTAAFWNSNVRDNLNEAAPLFSGWTTYTPTITSASGVIFVITVNDARYLKVGKLVVISFNISVPSAGTAGGAMLIPYPSGVTPKNATYQIGVGRETALTGYMFSITPTATNMQVNMYDNATPWASNRQFVGTITIEAT